MGPAGAWHAGVLLTHGRTYCTVRYNGDPVIGLPLWVYWRKGAVCCSLSRGGVPVRIMKVDCDIHIYGVVKTSYYPDFRVRTESPISG